MDIGKSTRIALAQRGKKMQWLADQLEVSKQRASQIAANEDSNTDTVKRLCKVFEIKKASEFIALGEVEY